MTELVLRTSRWALELSGLKHIAHPSRLLLLVLLASMLVSPELRPLVLGSIQDAYLAVTVYVAATLAVFYMIERGLGVDLGEKMEKAGAWQAPIASFLGALPGCGGAIIVVTQYTKGALSFGSHVAVLIAHMGAAAFLLLAREPSTGALILLTGFVVGTLSGWLIDAFHGRQFMRVNPQNKSQTNILVAQSVRIQAGAILGKGQFLVLADRVLSGLHAALRAGPDGCDPPYQSVRDHLLFGLFRDRSGWSVVRCCRYRGVPGADLCLDPQS